MIFSISSLDLWFESETCTLDLVWEGGNKAVYSVFFFPICLFLSFCPFFFCLVYYFSCV